MRKGGLSLSEEKKVVSEIDRLKKNKKALDGLSSQPASIEAEKQKIDIIRQTMEGIEKEIKTLEPQITAAKEQLTAAESILNESRGSVASLFESKKDLSEKMTEARSEKTALYTAFKATQDAYYTWEREDKKKRFELEKVARAAEREARLVAQAEQELEDADVAAYSNEIALCDALVKYFKVQGHLEEKSVAAPAAQDGAAIESCKPNARAVILPRKGDREEEFIVLGGKKKKGKGHGNPAAAQAKPIRMDLELLDQLSKLAIAIPKTTSDAAATVEALLAKKQHFQETSAAQTAANKEAALEKIKKLRAEVATESEE